MERQLGALQHKDDEGGPYAAVNRGILYSQEFFQDKELDDSGTEAGQLAEDKEGKCTDRNKNVLQNDDHVLHR